MRKLLSGARALSIVCMCGSMLGAAAQDSHEFKQGYSRGFKDGFDEGYRKAMTEQGAGTAAAVKGYPISIASAVYGPDGGASCDARRFVAPRANDRFNASIDVTNQMCGDPSPGKRKSLNINYFCGNVAKTASAYEHRTAYLSCD